MTDWADKTNGFACFLVGIIADFSDRKEDDICYKFLLIFAIILNSATSKAFMNENTIKEALKKGLTDGLPKGLSDELSEGEMDMLLLLDFRHDVIQDILVAHQLKPVFRVGELLVDLGGIEQIQRPFGIYLQCLGKHHDDVALFAPKYSVSHPSSSGLGE